MKVRSLGIEARSARGGSGADLRRPWEGSSRERTAPVHHADRKGIAHIDTILGDRSYTAGVITDIDRAGIGTDKGARPRVKILASDESVDRHGTVFEAKGWDLASFHRNPVLPWVHFMDGLLIPLGRATEATVKGKALTLVGEMALGISGGRGAVYDYHQTLVSAILEDLIRGVSVGAEVFEYQDVEGNRLSRELGDPHPPDWWWTRSYRQMLAEVSFTPLGSNMNAVQEPIRHELEVLAGRVMKLGRLSGGTGATTANREQRDGHAALGDGHDDGTEE